MGPIGCPETSARNYRYTLLNILELRRSSADLVQSDTKYSTVRDFRSNS
jgi:hypothetical protein